jgi:hypothetical protein
VREGLGVDPDLALADGRLLVPVHVLDRVLDRDDVARSALVDRVQHRGDGGRLPRPGRSRDEHQPLWQLHPLPHSVGQAEVVEARDPVRDQAQRQRHRSALVVGVAAEARLVLPVEGEVQLSLLDELVPELARQDATHGARDILGTHPRPLDRHDLTVDTDQRRRARDEEDIGAPPLPERGQVAVDECGVDVGHRVPFGS